MNTLLWSVISAMVTALATVVIAWATYASLRILKREGERDRKN